MDSVTVNASSIESILVVRWWSVVRRAQAVDIHIRGYHDGYALSLVIVNRSPIFFKLTSSFEYGGSRRTFITKHLFQF